jgi:thiol-disulfide isomerase/thioredoxin
MSILRLLVLAAVCGGGLVTRVQAQAMASNFTLTDRETGQAYQLADLAGHVIVLDFFAYWCGPCRASSPLLEQEVARYYASRGGNNHGIPVRVIPVNIQQNADAATDAFVIDLGLSHAADDRAGSVWGGAWAQFGEGAIPHFVVINGVADASRYQPWEVLHSAAGFPGSAWLRQLIDSVDGTVPTEVDLAWRHVASPRVEAAPFPVTLHATDPEGDVLTTFTNAVSLSAYAGDTGSITNVAIGHGTGSWDYPMHTYFHDARTQVIYLADEVGTACTITSLTLDVTSPPGQMMSDWTIRMKHTELAAYPATPRWEGSDWTLVYQDHEPVGGTGERVFTLDPPFAYNGTDHLMVDFSFDNDSWSGAGRCRCTVMPSPRAIYFYTDSQHGSPLDWSGVSPAPEVSPNVPNLVLGTRQGGLRSVTVTPHAAGPFVDGRWRGAVTVHEAASNVFLRAEDGEGHRADSNLFQVDPDVDLDGLSDRWERAYFPSLTNVSYLTDWDQDGSCDGHEFHAGTVVTNATSFLGVTSVSIDPARAEAVVRWSSSSNKYYAVYAVSDPVQGDRTLLREDIPATSPEAVYTDAVAGVASRMYAIEVVP